jgi:hypothetical protein
MKTVHAEAGSVHEGGGAVLFHMRGGGEKGQEQILYLIHKVIPLYAFLDNYIVL